MGLGIRKRYLKLLSTVSKKVYCINCNKNAAAFLPLAFKLADRSDFINRANVIGSDLKNYRCIYCSCNDRLRHLIMYFDHINLWDIMEHKNILHIAPEKALVPRIKAKSPSKYVQGDFMIFGGEVEQVDISNIQYPDESFDLVICNHVLEHVPAFNKALREFYRVLKPGGIAILQTPIATKFRHTFVDPEIRSEEDKVYYYGQKDHVHLLSKTDFLAALQETGFTLNLVEHEVLSKYKQVDKYGVNPREFLVRVTK